MQTKRKRAKLAKVLRKHTGLDFVQSLKAAKALLRGTEYSDNVVEYTTFCECCGPEPVLKGPKGFMYLQDARHESFKLGGPR